jgi:hypothetical protein
VLQQLHSEECDFEVVPKTVEKTSPIMCVEHDGEIMNVYCLQHGVLACARCVLQKHPDCKSIDIEVTSL